MVPEAQEAEVGGSRSKATMGKSSRSYLKEKLKQKMIRGWLECRALA
jgi:hypothetical protein